MFLFGCGNPVEFFPQLLLTLLVVGINLDAGNRAYHHALGGVEVSYAFGAQGRFDLVNLLTLINCVVWAFRLADVTIDAFTRYTKSHRELRNDRSSGIRCIEFLLQRF